MERLMTADEIGNYLVLSGSTIRKMAGKKIIPSRRISHKVVRFDLHEVMQAIKERGDGLVFESEQKSSDTI